MLYSPREQFEIIPLLSLRRGMYDISLTNSSLRMLLTVGLIVRRSQRVFDNGGGTIVPSRQQVVREGVQARVLSVIGQTIGPRGAVFYPFRFAVFSFVRGCNRLGLIPYSFTVTSHLIVTRTLSLAIQIGKLVIGLRLHGQKLFGLFRPAGTPFAMIPFMVPIEVLGFTIPFVSLAVRLFANMMSGHVRRKVIAGFAQTMMAAGGLLQIAHQIPRVVLFLLMFLETAVAVIQAYVFTRLTAIYLSDMVHGGH